METKSDSPTHAVDQKIARLHKMSRQEIHSKIRTVARIEIAKMSPEDKRSLVVRALESLLDKNASTVEILRLAHHPQIQKFPDLKYALCDYDARFLKDTRFMIIAVHAACVASAS